MIKTPVSSKAPSLMGQLAKTDPNLISFLKQGDLIEAKMLAKTGGVVYFDLGKFGTGVVFGSELLNAKNIVKALNMGDAVSAKIIDLENEDGYVELSLVNAHQQKSWQQIEELKEKDEPFGVKISGANSGGLVVEISEIKAFLPVSQLSSEHYPRIEKGDKAKILAELKKLVGQELNVKIIDFNPRTNKLIISEKAVTEGDVKKHLEKYSAGDIIDGIVSSTADFGAFIRFADNPAIEGLIHISELDHKLIDSPKDVVKINEAIKAKIIEIKDGKVFLSLKALKPNPWDSAAERFKEGQEAAGTVYKYNPFGAYVSLAEDIWGMIHVSEFGSLDELKQQLEIGSKHDFTVESVKPEEKKIILKLKKEIQ